MAATIGPQTGGLVVARMAAIKSSGRPLMAVKSGPGPFVAAITGPPGPLVVGTRLRVTGLSATTSDYRWIAFLQLSALL